MRLSFKHILLPIAMMTFNASFAQGAQGAQDKPTFGVTAQFLKICEPEHPSYNELLNRVVDTNWSKVSTPEAVEEFFPELDNFLTDDDAAIFKYVDVEFDLLFEGTALMPTEKWFLGLARVNMAGRSAVMCQIRTYDENIDGLAADFEQSVHLVQSGHLVKETVSNKHGFKKYVYYNGSNESFYNVWERQLDDGGHAFAISKTLIEIP